MSRVRRTRQASLHALVRDRAPRRFVPQPGLGHVGGRFPFCWAFCLLALSAIPAEAQFQEDFEGPRPSWRMMEADCAARLLSHRRAPDQGRGGRGCEHLRIVADSGSYVYAGHSVPGSRVISELASRVWVRSDRPGVQLLVRVVLPRTTDPATGQPVSTLLAGTAYDRVGSWQQLMVEDPLPLLARKVRVLRAQIGSHVDPTEAYADLLVLNVYGGRGETNVWIDDLEVQGRVAAATVAPSLRSASPGGSPPGPGPAAAAEEPMVAGATMQGSLLLVDGRPFFPHAVEQRGEPLEFLARLGFNAVQLGETPSGSQLSEARRLGVRLLCPPPDLGGGAPMLAGCEPVLAWNLGRGLTDRDLSRVRHLSDLLRQSDEGGMRPLYCSADSELWEYSRRVDVLLHERAPLGTSFPLADFGAWLAQRPRLARPGTPIWATIQTEPAPELLCQLRALAGDQPWPAATEPEQLRGLTYAALAAGARGVLFQSRGRLDAADVPTRLRAATLELLNLELSLVEPWAAGGSHVSTVPTSDPQLQVAVLATDRARLLIPLVNVPDAQCVSGPVPDVPVSFVVPGVPESVEAYQLVPTGLRPLRHLRVTGGLRVHVDQSASHALCVLSQDPLVISSLARRLATIRNRAATLEHDVSRMTYQLVSQVDQALTAQQVRPPAAERALGEARANLDHAARLLEARDHLGTQQYAQRARQSLAEARRAHWTQVSAVLPSPVSSPGCAQFTALPLHAQLARRLQAAHAGGAALAGGEFEDLDLMVRLGWQHFEHAPEAVRTAVALAPENPHSGRYALRIEAATADPAAPTPLLETPPVWISTAPVPVQQGMIVLVQGWLRIDQPIQPSLDGLLIIDSLGGMALAQRFRQTDGWRPFASYRVVDRDQSLYVTFALTGVGRVELDDVTVQTFLPAPVPQVPGPSSTATP